MGGMVMNPVLNSELFEAFANASDKTYVYVADLKAKITRWSKATVDYFDLPGEYIENSTAVWLECVHPDDREAYITDLRSVLNGNRKQHNCQYRARNKYGDYNWVECKGSVIFDEDGKPDLFAGLMTRLDNHNKYDSVTHLLTGHEMIRYAFGEDGAVMVIGIDGLRKINSENGFVYGNNVLMFLSKVLQSEAGRATIYRFQGDEFVVYGKGMTTDEMADIFLRVKAVCDAPDKEEELAGFSITAGIADFKKDEETNDIMTRMENCYNYAKENHVGTFTVYSEYIENKINRRKLVSEDLLKSIKNNFKGFRLVYQPILANTGDYVVGCEALLRYTTDNPAVGNCYPDEFISILESNGGMTEVGYFVMREAIRQAAEWQKRYKWFSVSFNVSYVQLEDTNFVPSIIEAIKEYGADPLRITAELTESILNVDTVKVKKSFELLRENGIKIALDDFGTGNSSFWMLHNIDVDIVKLDQSFIRKLDTEDNTGIDHAIVESVGIMCNRIGCSTVAEGIETEAIWKTVSDYGFTGLQGYLFSRPIEVKEFEELLEKYNMAI